VRGSAVYAHLWGTDELRAAFEDEGRLQAWLDVLAALAEAQGDLGIIPADAAAEIAARSRLERLDLDYLVAETRATQHSTLGLIRAMQRVLSPAAGEWYCYGATVQDVSDTWVALTMRRVGAVVHRDLMAIEGALLDAARRHRDLPMAGRTHGQTGVPITLGFKLAVWAGEVRRHLVRLREGAPRWLVGQLGGAAGTGSFWGEAAPALLDAFCARLGLGVPEIPWVSARDRPAEFASLLVLVDHTLAKMGNEVVELARPEIGELAEPFTPGQVGSITMPHKRNPERAEHLVTLARLARADLSVLLESTVVEHERDGRAWKAEWAAFPDLCLLSGTACQLARGLVEGMTADSEAMVRNLRAGGGYLASERVMRALAERTGKQSAHQLVYEAAMAGREAGLAFREALAAAPGIGALLSPAELDGLCDPAIPEPSAGLFVDRVIERCERARASEQEDWP
jgi:adenylosuccinate lyase